MTHRLVKTYGGEASQYTAESRNYTREFTLTADFVLDRQQIFAITGVPHRWDPWGPDDLGALCVGVDIDDERENELIYRIVATYTSAWGRDEDPQDQSDDPLLRRTKWRYASVPAKRTQHKDLRGNDYETAAGEPFRTPPQVNYSTTRYTIVRPEATFDSDLADAHASVVNTQPWYSKPPGTVLMESIQAEEQWEGDGSGAINYWTVTYVVHVDPRFWQPVEVQNKGSFYFDGGFPAGTKTFPMDGGQRTGEHVWLKADGDLLPDADPRIYLDFFPYNEADLNVFNL